MGILKGLLHKHQDSQPFISSRVFSNMIGFYRHTQIVICNPLYGYPIYLNAFPYRNLHGSTLAAYRTLSNRA